MDLDRRVAIADDTGQIFRSSMSKRGIFEESERGTSKVESLPRHQGQRYDDHGLRHALLEYVYL